MNQRWCAYSSRMRILGLGVYRMPRCTWLSGYVTWMLLGLPMRKGWPLVLILTICGWWGETLRLLLRLAQLIVQCRLPGHAQLLLLGMADM